MHKPRVLTRRKSRNTLGFILLRHVNSKNTNMYWQEAYDCIRKFYPENKIVIIDDNSKKNFLTEKELYKTTVVESEYPGRGELLPYYYYSRNKWFDTAVVLHDSVFVNKYIDFTHMRSPYTFIWDFDSDVAKQEQDEVNIIESLSNNESLLKFYSDRSQWRGCFGAMTIIKYSFLKGIDDTYDLSKLLPVIRKRYNRMSFERVFACILQANHKPQSLLGDILKYCKWGLSYSYYMKNKDKITLPFIKIWTGR